MEKRFKVGDHVTWDSEAGRVSGEIIKVHTRDVDYKGRAAYMPDAAWAVSGIPQANPRGRVSPRF